MCRDQGSGTETKDKEKRSAEASIEARHADTETREKTTGETDRVEGSAEAPGSGAEAKDIAIGVSGKISSRAEESAGGTTSGTDAHFSARLISATATRVLRALFVILPLGASPINTH